MVIWPNQIETKLMADGMKRVEKTHARQLRVRLYAAAYGRCHLNPTPSSGAPLQDASIDIKFSSYNAQIGGKFFGFL